jgi:outer membrane protein OmpA-like peptidoglycan-associated protein
MARLRTTRHLTRTAAIVLAVGLVLGALPAAAAGTPHRVPPAIPASAVSQTNRFLNVACATSGACVAVGSYSGAAGTAALLDVEIAGTWNVVTAQLPADASTASTVNVLDAVACPSAGNCVVAGQASVASGTAALVDVETSGTWANDAVPLPANASTSAPNNSLGAVTCASVGNCVAVGSYVNTGGNQQALLVVESSGVWSDVVVPVPADATATAPNDSLNAVACVDAADCAASGSYVNTAGQQQALLVASTSGTWSDVVVPLPANASTSAAANTLDTLSCPAVGGCIAAGSYVDSGGNQQALLVTATAGSWADVPAPLPADESSKPSLNSLNSIACASASSCVTVGVYQNANGFQEALVDTWTAGTWSAVTAPLPPDANVDHPFDTLSAVTCPAVDSCVAVGFYSNVTMGYLYPQALLEVEVDGSWQAGSVKLPPDASTRLAYSVLSSVTCVSILGCAATGLYSDKHGNTQALLDLLGPALSPVSVVPDAPTVVTVVSGHGQAKVSWTPPPTDGGSPITSYTATASPGGHACSTSTGTHCTIRPLVSAPRYTITVTASTVIGTSAPSLATHPITIERPIAGTITIAPFAANSSALATPLAAQVAHLAAVLVLWGDTRVLLSGYSDNRGSVAARRAVSVARARAVQTALLEELADRAVFDVTARAVAKGFANPIAMNGTAAGRAKNRRVVASLR